MISVCNVTKNRNENLEKCWRTWLFADEVIILDYGSDSPIKINHPKVKVFRYNSDGFGRTKGLNMVIELAKGDIIIQADSDYYFNRCFLEKNLSKNEFIGEVENITQESENAVSLSGFCMFWKSDWKKINGYNERFKYYGYDDTDFYNRLRSIGLRQKKIKSSDITHIPHSSRSRLLEFGTDTSETRSSQLRHKHVHKNKNSSINNPWTLNDKMSIFNENI